MNIPRRLFRKRSTAPDGALRASVVFGVIKARVMSIDFITRPVNGKYRCGMPLKIRTEQARRGARKTAASMVGAAKRVGSTDGLQSPVIGWGGRTAGVPLERNRTARRAIPTNDSLASFPPLVRMSDAMKRPKKKGRANPLARPTPQKIFILAVCGAEP